MLAGDVPGLWKLGRSYLSLDTDGRVVRLDSFAKFLAPGFRLGWLTAHPTFVDKLTFHMHGTALGPCSTTQVGNALNGRRGSVDLLASAWGGACHAVQP